MVVAGLGMGDTGLILDFPSFGQSRLLMQVAQVIHASLAALFIAASLYRGVVILRATNTKIEDDSDILWSMSGF